MNCRNSIISSIGLVTIYASLTFGYGGVLDATGRPCEECKKNGETQGGSAGDGGKDSSDPINISTGDFQLAQTDLSIPGRGLDFEIQRFYRSYSGLQTIDVDFIDPNYDVNRANDDFNTRNSSDQRLGDLNGSSPIGDHWDFNYNMRISTTVPQNDPDHEPGPRIWDEFSAEIYPAQIHLLSGDGRIDVFNSYDSQPDPNSASKLAFYKQDKDQIAKKILYRGFSSTISMLDSNMTEYRFYPVYTAMNADSFHQYAGRLESIVDRNGNTIQFIYELTPTNSVPRINYAIDTLGNQIDFVYHDQVDYDGNSSSHTGYHRDWDEHTIWIIADLIDGIDGVGTPRREWRYEYEEYFGVTNGFFRVLKNVTLPRIKDDADFPMGGDVQHARFDQSGDRKWEFEYGNVTQWERRLLSKITNPNGETVLENEFWGDLQNPANDALVGRNAARVSHQHYGSSTYSFVASHVDPSFYTDVSGSIDFLNSGDLGPDYYVWVNDRRGAITRFKYSGADVPGNASGPFHRALLEKVEYKDAVPVGFENKVVWATVDASENHTWYYIDTNGDPQLLTGYSDSERYVKSWEWDDHWNPTEEQQSALHAPPAPISQDQDSVSYVYDLNSEDPLRWGALLSRTRKDSNGAGGVTSSITEEWLYDLDFGGDSGSGGGNGCGCASDLFVTAYKDGNNNVTLKDYDTTPNPVTGRAEGNLLKIYHDIPNSTIGTALPSNASSVEEFDYNAHGQVIQHIHPLKETLTGSLSREDRFEYDSNPASISYGRMTRKIVDYGGLNLTTKYQYDAVGNLILVIDPGGDLTLFYYNQDSNLIKREHFDSTMSALYARVEYFYDANGNVVQEEVANLIPDAQSPGGALIHVDNPSITTLYEHDEHDYLTKTAREHGDMPGTATSFTNSTNGKVTIPISQSADALHIATEEWVYDEAKNLIKHTVGETANGSDQTVAHYEYDARDLLVRQYYGVDELSILVDIEFDRDQKGRISNAHINPNDPAKTQTYQAEYDGFDRMVGINDPMGNTIAYEYDNNFNVTRTSVFGPYEEDTTGDDTLNSVTLMDTISEHDARDRLEFQKVQVYDYNYGGSIGIGSVSEQVIEYKYNNDDSIRKLLIPTSSGSPNLIEYFYDTASRLESIIDSDGNGMLNSYDVDSNLISELRTDTASDGLGTQEVFKTEYQYDAIDRAIKIIQDPQNLALETVLAYDSRSNVVKQTDPRGNFTDIKYDGMNRVIETSVAMTDTGDGNGSQINGADGTIKTMKTYDDSSRLVSETDDNGNATTYEYDALNRIARVVMPDGEDYKTTYDQNGNVSTYTDARDVVITQQYDLNNRLVSRALSGTIVPGTTSESYKYDGLGRLIEATNDFAKIVRKYDSRSNVVLEIQNVDAPSFLASNDRIVQYDHDNANNLTQIVYPSGRVIDRSYDNLNRLAGVSDQLLTNPLITQFDYVGNRLLRRTNGNGTQTDYAYNGYEGYVGGSDLGFGRVASISTTNSTSGIELDAFDFTWDANQNRTTYKDTGSGMINRRERSFGYDSSNRLISTDVDYPDLLTDYTAPINNGITQYALDGVHNRIDVTGFDENGAQIGTYAVNENNQYTVSPRGNGADWIYLYDENGNMILKAQSSFGDFNEDYSFNQLDISMFLTSYGNQDAAADINGDGAFNFLDVNAFMGEYQANLGVDLEHVHYTYDFQNRLIDVSQKAGSSTVQNVITNQYDALSRRVVETIDGLGDGTIDGAKHMVYGCASLWEVIEQIDLLNNDEVLSTHVFGLGIDDEVHYQRPNASQGQKNIWSHRDDLNTLTSITNEAGNVLERFEYGDYGLDNVFDALGNPQTGTLKDAFHLFTGRIQISGTELYDYRYRVLSSELGRFMQRDPLGYVDGMNLYTYVRSSPMSWLDAFGLMLGPNDDYLDDILDGDYVGWSYRAKERNDDQKELTHTVYAANEIAEDFFEMTACMAKCMAEKIAEDYWDDLVLKFQDLSVPLDPNGDPSASGILGYVANWIEFFAYQMPTEGASLIELANRRGFLDTAKNLRKAARPIELILFTKNVLNDYMPECEEECNTCGG